MGFSTDPATAEALVRETLNISNAAGRTIHKSKLVVMPGMVFLE